MKIINQTDSLCIYCFKKIEAEIIEENNKIYLTKTCPEHGNQKVLIWSDASTYRDWTKNSSYAPKYSDGAEVNKGCPFDCGYCSDHRGTSCTAVIEVTQKCNMKCNVCFASADHTGTDLSIEKIKEMINYTADTQGFCSLQLSGGECTLREDLPDIVKYAKGIGFKHIQINTNGIRISNDLDYTKKLKEAGADLIYLGFDGVTDDIYRKVRNKEMLQIKKACIENCKIAGIGVMLVPVIIKDINDTQVGKIIEFAKAYIPTIKGVHFQPASQFGRYEVSDAVSENRYTIPDLLADLKTQTDGEICPCQVLPRKKMSAYCSFSSAYYLDENNKLVPLTKREEGNSLPVVSSCCSTKDSKMHTFARKTNDFTERFWKQNTANPKNKETKLGKFNNRLNEYSFVVSAMPFQDVWNVDLDRIRSCCVSVIDESLKTIPLCLYYLTDINGNKLYRGGKCTI